MEFRAVPIFLQILDNLRAIFTVYNIATNKRSSRRSRWGALLVMYETNQYVLGKIVCSIVSLFKDRQKLQEVTSDS